MVLLSALAAVVIAVLLHGAARQDRPGSGAATPAPAPELSAPPPETNLEKTPLSYVSDYWLQLGNRARARLLLVGPRKVPALVLAPDLAVSTVDAADAPVGEISDDGSGNPSPRLLARDATVGLALFEVKPPLADNAFSRADPASLHPGMLVAGITVDARGRLLVMPGHLISAPGPSTSDAGPEAADSLDVFVPLAPSTRAAAIVDLDGNLVGAILRHGESTRVLSAESLLKAVTRLRAHPTCRGIEVADLDPAVRTLLGVGTGVAVERVAREAFRPEPSILPGDVLIGWKGHDVKHVAEFLALYDAEPPGALVPHVLRRGPRIVRGSTVMPGPDCRPPLEPPVVLAKAGLTLASASGVTDGPATPAPWRVTAVEPRGSAQGSGVQPGDWILSAGGSRPDREAILRELGAFERTGRPMVLALQRGDRVKLVALHAEGR
jgi:S1-C subfamily serine protease